MADQFNELEVLFDPNDQLDDPVKRKAMAAALRRQNAYGTLGQLMGVQPTMQAGAAIQEGAQTSLRSALAKQQAAKEAAARATERQQMQDRWEAEQKRQAERDAEQRRQFAIQEARLGRTSSDENWVSVTNPITGETVMVNKKNPSQTMPVDFSGQGKPSGQEGPLPQFNPARGMKPTTQMQNDLIAIQQQRGAVEGALSGAKANPNAFGFKEGALERFGGDVGTAFAQWKRNPQDTATRAFVLNNVSAIINERAGAAQSAQELARLRGFLPSETDDVAHVEAKFNAFLDYLDEREAATRGYTPTELGFKPRTGVGPRKPEYQTPGTAPAVQGPAPLRDPTSYIPGGG
jgi:hypothetical protein